MKPVLLDTGVIVALLDATDSFHKRCAEAIAGLGASLITCEPVISESCYLLREIEGASEAILRSVATREFQLPKSLSQSASEVRRVLNKYRDHAIDLADAFLVHLADEFNTGDILTIDRDFRFYRWGRNNSFRMLVPLD